MQQELERIDAEIARWEARLAAGERLGLEPALDAATNAARSLIRAYLAAEGKKPVPSADADLLEAFKLLVKGDPSWNAIRDNLRELVYYRNCIDLKRADALPARPDAMAVRTVRHIYLYLHSRSEQEGRLVQD